MTGKNLLRTGKNGLVSPLLSVEEMERESIAFIREHEPPEGYFCGFSGGKDSIVAEYLLRRSGVKYRAFYSSTGIDPPEVVRFIREHYPEIPFLKPPMTFWNGIRKKSPPLRMMRWCCDLAKKQPAKPAVIKALCGDPLRHRVMGIRAEESYRRANRPRIDKYRGITTYKPIFYWKEWHIWELIESRQLPYPSLYGEGFGRIGCVICPFIMGKNQRNLERHRERWPAIYRIFERVVTDWFLHHRRNIDRYNEQTPAEYLAAYYRGFTD